MRAVLVVELDLPDDEPGAALHDAAMSVGSVTHAVGMRAAIREDAERVLAVFTEETP